MKNYLFEVIEEGHPNEGEQFLVGADSYDEAKKIAYSNFGECDYHGTMSDWEAEESGLDEF